MKNALIGRQAQGDTRLGELLIRMGIIDAGELRAMLSLQAELRAAHGKRVTEILRKRFRLGRLLVDSGVIDEAALQAALAESRRSDRKLGESLVRAGAISSEVLHRCLHRQRRLTTAALAAAAVSTVVAAPAAARDGTTVHVAATVLAHASIESLRLPRDIAISPQDVERGYVDVEEPVAIRVRSNYPGGVRLGFAVNSAQLSSVDVLASESAHTDGSSVFVPQRERGLQQQGLSLRLRLKLAPGAAPGRISLPVSVSLTPA